MAEDRSLPDDRIDVVAPWVNEVQTAGDDAPTPPPPPRETLGPTPVRLRVGQGPSVEAMAALTGDALWLQQAWRLRRVPLRDVSAVEERRKGRVLLVRLNNEPDPGTLTLRFGGRDQGRLWRGEVETRARESCAAPPYEGRVPEGVTLVESAGGVAHEGLGLLECQGETEAAAVRGLQLKAGMLGADAVVGTHRRPGTGLDEGDHVATGSAVRAEGEAAGRQLRYRWYDHEVGGLVKRMSLLLVVPECVYLLLGTFGPKKVVFSLATGQSPGQELLTTALVLGVCFTWPLALVGAHLLGRFPQLLRVTGLAVLGWTTGRRLTLLLAHTLAQGTADHPSPNFSWLAVFDPFDWAVILYGVVLCRRAWRLAGDAAEALPPAAKAGSAGRRRAVRAVGAVTVALAATFLAVVAVGRYQATSHLLRPGVDPQREHEGLLAMNEGTAHSQNGDHNSARRSFEQALAVWEKLAAGSSAPPLYRYYLSVTLGHLNYTAFVQNRMADSEAYDERIAAMEGRVGDTEEQAEDHRSRVRGARQALAERKEARASQQLDEKDKAAARKYEEAQVKSQQGAADAAGMFREAIAVWEEVLAKATAPEYRKFAVARLATAYLVLGETEQKHGKAREAEAALLKGIELGEKALAEQPDRPLIKHNLEVARLLLSRQRDQAFQDEINKLCEANRLAEARDAYVKGITEVEGRLRAGQDREVSSRALAHRLSRLAWFLSHCPDPRVVDTKAAAQHARRAAEMQPDVSDYWYTLATALYRDGRWKDSLATLDRLKAKEGGFDGYAWLVVAMNQHQLKQRAEARAAYKKANEWIDERRRQSRDDPLLRLQYDLTLSTFEPLRREAEGLVDKKQDAF